MLDWNLEVLGAGGCEKGEICKNMKIGKSWKMGWESSGGFRLVQSDQRNCRNVFKQVLAKNSLKKHCKP